MAGLFRRRGAAAAGFGFVSCFDNCVSCALQFNAGVKQMKELEGKTVIITGGGKGVGLGTATAFAAAGANLVLTGRTADAGLAAKTDLEQRFGVQVLPVAADGSDEKAVAAAVRQTVETFGQIDVLVNNAQNSKSGTLLEDHTKTDFDLAIYSGLYAGFFYMRECFPYLKETKGTVINFASGAGLAGLIGQASYAAAKEGIRGLSRVAAREWGEYGITVNVVCPLVYTPRLKRWCEENHDLCAETLREVPLGRYGDAEKDVGSVCVFLASAGGRFITGQTIGVDGGTSIRP